MPQRFWNRQTFVLIGIYLIIILRVLSGFGVFKYPGDQFLGDFSHILTYEDFFVTGGDYLAWHPPAAAFNAEYAPVFPGLILFFLPFMWIGGTASKVLLIISDIIFPFFTTYLVAKATQLPFSWRLWKPSRVTFITLFIFAMIIFSRPYMSSLIPGQFTSLIFFLLLYSLIYSKGWALACATVLKFSLSIWYFPWFVLHKKHKEVVKALLLFVMIMLFPVIYFPNLLTLYYDYILKMTEHFTSSTIDTFAGCKAGCWMLVESGWFLNNKLNILFKAALLISLFYVYWKNRGREQPELHALIFIGAVTLLLFYHRIYDEMLVTVPLLMILIIHLKERDWVHAAFPTLIYLYYLLPSRAWHYLIAHVGPWMEKIGANPSLVHFFPLDSLAVMILAVFALKRIWCGQDRSWSVPQA